MFGIITGIIVECNNMLADVRETGYQAIKAINRIGLAAARSDQCLGTLRIQ